MLRQKEEIAQYVDTTKKYLLDKRTRSYPFLSFLYVNRINGR